MSRTKKIILFVVLPVLASCCLLCVAFIVLVPRLLSNAVASDPQAAKQIGARIADYTLPRGYQEMMGMDLFSAQWVLIAPSDQRGGTAIMLMQFATLNEGNYDPKQMEQQMQQAMERQYDQSGTFQSTGQRTVTIKGRPTDLALAERDQITKTVRQATGVFDGKNGMVMLMVIGNVDTWDWKMVEDFCASIR